MNQNSARLNVFRGLMMAVICALAGVTVSVAVLSAIAVCRWYAWGANDVDWRYEMSFVTNAMPSMISGFAAVFGAAGWATYAPRGSFRLAKTLAIILLVSLPLWFLVWYAAEWIGLSPRQSKDDYAHAEFAGLLTVLTVSILTSAGLTAVRIRAAKQSVAGDPPPPRTQVVPIIEPNSSKPRRFLPRLPIPVWIGFATVLVGVMAAGVCVGIAALNRHDMAIWENYRLEHEARFIGVAAHPLDQRRGELAAVLALQRTLRTSRFGI
ncbi:MAG TPA: hypothetical protein VGM05_05705 [Planctomycetaceae bacterium]